MGNPYSGGNHLVKMHMMLIEDFPSTGKKYLENLLKNLLFSESLADLLEFESLFEFLS